MQERKSSGTVSETTAGDNRSVNGWMVSRADGHEILEALNDPIEGEPRVEKTYSRNTPPQQRRIETAGMTRVYPAGYVQDSLVE